MILAGALVPIVLSAVKLAITLTLVLQIEFIVASFLDQASVHPSEEIWFQKPHQKPPDKTRVITSRGLISQIINCQASPKKELNHQGKRGRSAELQHWQGKMRKITNRKQIWNYSVSTIGGKQWQLPQVCSYGLSILPKIFHKRYIEQTPMESESYWKGRTTKEQLTVPSQCFRPYNKLAQAL